MRQSLFVLSLAACFGAMSAASAETPNYKLFSSNQSFRAYIDLNNQSVEANGYRDVNVRMEMVAFQDSIIAFLKTYYPDPERVSYATESYAVDCAGRMTKERILILFDSAGTVLTQADLGRPVEVPAEGTMSFYVLKEVCGG